MRTTVQAMEPTYELHSLGWKAFQQLCLSIASEVWGQVVQGYFDSHDGGRDGAFHGVWRPKAGEYFEGSFTIQCKFSSQPTKTLIRYDLNDELSKATRLAARGLSDNYILFTSTRLTGVSEENIKAAFEAVPGIKRFAAYGADRISQFIRESPRLRMLVPRVYGLGDLSQILDERAYDQAKDILSALGDDLAKFVITDAYQRSAKALVEHGFVMLLGEPACGKSTIAAALAVGALDEWGCFTLKIRDADEFVRYSNPHESKQFFWVDDAFGATQLDWQGTIRWNQVFPHIQAAVRRGAKIVFTSRDYIYRSARNFLKESALPVLHESQVVIRVEDLSKEEREQILYNHVRLGTQTKQVKAELKSFLPTVASHRRFSPEIARRLGNPAFTKQLIISTFGLAEFVAHPMELLKEIIRTLDVASRSAIALVFMRGGALLSPLTLGPEEERAIALFGGSAADVRSALVALASSFVIQVKQGAQFIWRFKHPTIRDAFAALVAENRELMDIYLAGTPVRQLFAEVSCGDVDLEGVKVVVPTDRYETVLLRIRTFSSTDRESRDAVNRFLARHCDREFLQKFLGENPGFIRQLLVYSYLYAVSDVGVIVRLHEVGLLPESERVRHVDTIRHLAVETPDSGFMRKYVRGLFTTQEYEDTLEYVRSTLLPNLEECIDNWGFNCDDEPAQYFSELESALGDYKEAFSNEEASISYIDAGLAKMNETIASLSESRAAQRTREDDFYERRGPLVAVDEARSIFDDVDE